MSDKVDVPFEGKARDKAVLLLAAAETLGLDKSVVEARTTGKFVVPQEVYDEAFGEQKSPAKKTAAKKTTEKKSTAKKAQE